MTEPAIISTDRLINNLDHLIGLPGSPGQIDELSIVAANIAALMHDCGLHTDVITTSGAPVVIGRRAGRQPFTLLLYHHYDVAPPGIWRIWHHDPFQMAEREGILYGRGVAGGKGPLVAHLNALAALIETEGELPCGVVVCAEGEGLVGSSNLGQVVAQARDLFQADACLATGGERDTSGRPFCYSGVKGLLQVRMRLEGPEHALPAGLAPSVPNPLWRMLWALGQIKNDQEEILIEGFYDEIEGPSRAESKILRTAFVDQSSRSAAWKMQQFLFGMSGAALAQAEATLPTCNISGIGVEPVTDMAVIPVAVTVRLDFQLVPQQQPQAITELLHTHLYDKGLGDIQVERLAGGYPATGSQLEHPFIQHVSAVGQHIYSAPLLTLPRGPFALP